MQTVALLSVLVAVAVAMPRPDDLKPGVIPVIERTEVRDPSGQYSLSYVSGDGTRVQEQGALKPTADGKDYVLVKQGEYSYTSKEGLPVLVRYTADENGFVAVSDSIPKVPVA